MREGLYKEGQQARKQQVALHIMDSRLKELLDCEENGHCADCTEANPTWASTNWGVFICVQCAGVHR